MVGGVGGGLRLGDVRECDNLFSNGGIAMSDISLSDKVFLWVRVGAVTLIAVLAFVTARYFVNDDSVKAPLLTIMGGTALIVNFYPLRGMGFQDIIQNLVGIAGTFIAMVGGYYWLSDALKEKPDDFLASYIILLCLFLLFMCYVLIWVVIDTWAVIKKAAGKIWKRGCEVIRTFAYAALTALVASRNVIVDIVRKILRR